MYQRIIQIVMNSLPFILILCLTFCFGDGSSLSTINDDDAMPVDERIEKIVEDTAAICTSIKTSMVPLARQFQSLIDDAHEKCPAFATMERVLANIAFRAADYTGNIQDVLYECQKQSDMLTKGLESGSMALYFLRAGDYTLSSDIVDNWHKSFSNIFAQFTKWHIPLDVMMNNKKIFYYEDWNRVIILFIIKTALALTGSIILASLITFSVSNYGPFKAPDTLSQNPPKEQPKVPHAGQGLGKASDPSDLTNSSGVKRRKTKGAVDTEVIQNNQPKPPAKSYHMVFRYAFFFFVFFLSILIILYFAPQVTLFPKAERYNWYPEATRILENMKTYLDALEANVSKQVDLLSELRRYVNMYLDEKFQKTVKEFVNELVGALKHARTELSDTCAVGVKVDSTISDVYQTIEEKAIRLGKIEVAQPLLNDLSKAKKNSQVLHKHLYTAVHVQSKMIPDLKKQTKAMRSLLKNRRLNEMGEIAEKHLEIVIDIGGLVFEVSSAIKDVLEVIENEKGNGAQKKIESLENGANDEQRQAMIEGGLSVVAGGVGVKVATLGLSVAAAAGAPIAVPLMCFAGIAGSVGAAGYGIIKSMSSYFKEAEFKGDLKDLEIILDNFAASLKRLDQATKEQKRSLDSVRLSLSKLADYCGRFHTVAGVVIPAELQRGIRDELDNLMDHYTKQIGHLSLFANHVPNQLKIDEH